MRPMTANGGRPRTELGGVARDAVGGADDGRGLLPSSSGHAVCVFGLVWFVRVWVSVCEGNRLGGCIVFYVWCVLGREIENVCVGIG